MAIPSACTLGLQGWRRSCSSKSSWDGDLGSSSRQFWQYDGFYGVADLALRRLDHRIQQVCRSGVSEYAAINAIVRERPSYLSHDVLRRYLERRPHFVNVRLCVDSYKRRPTSIEAVQEEARTAGLFSPPLIKYIRAKPSIPRQIRGRGPGSRKFQQEVVSWVERDLFGGAGSLEMQARLVFDVRMLTHEWQALLGFGCFSYESLVDKDPSTPDVVFDKHYGPFVQEKYDELVEDLEAGKMITACGGFNKLSALLGNACVDLFNFQVGELIKRYGELRFKVNLKRRRAHDCD
ncbi:hypothetical protein SELMODRAFT_416232 [Selaginella moellendorffii]|uniref:Uncharacterized protein n=1 Tax=Selaginella moellendorffii TaxID=88036 RepID=D8RYH9_SELML|nr:hypothetical protein SELMODRAFT_416232 [Selaginella moellendorffii]